MMDVFCFERWCFFMVAGKMPEFALHSWSVSLFMSSWVYDLFSFVEVVIDDDGHEVESKTSVLDLLVEQEIICFS